jgi:GntR family transcriptional regulator/MocR family aminotransferase
MTKTMTRLGSRQIYDELKRQIGSGAFGADGRLPSSRALALELDVSRTTVTAAYEQLTAEGYTSVSQGARPRVANTALAQEEVLRSEAREPLTTLSQYGERVRESVPWIDYLPSKRIADFRYGDLKPSDFPATAWKRAMNAAMISQADRLAYDDPRGLRRLRLALQGYLWRSRNLTCDIDQIIIVNGSQQGLDLCARLLLDPEDRFVIEEPCYAMARRIFASTGATAVPINVDDAGLDTARLAECKARLAYVTPSHQFPLGSVMSISRRQQLLNWAERQNAYVIEDDYDSEYRYDIKPAPPLYSLNGRDNVLYVGTVSKTLSPLLRLGYLVVPGHLREVFAAAKQLTDRHSPLAEQIALASIIEDGIYEKHVRRVRRSNGERRHVLLSALNRWFGDRIIVSGADAGLHVVVHFKEVPLQREDQFIEEARRVGVGLYPISPLYARDTTAARMDAVGLVMGYASLDVRRIERGVELLAGAANALECWKK